MIKRIFGIFIGIAIFIACQQPSVPQMTTKDSETKIAIAIHGGAGNLKKMKLSEVQENEYKAALDSALEIGYDVLKKGGTSVEACEASVRYMEDCPLFNAGKGAVFNHEGKNEMDAAIMDGSNLSCGAVAGVHRIKNPISTARRIMDKSEFILLSGEGAESFAESEGLELVDTSYFFTSFRWQQLQDAIKEDSVELDHSGSKSSKLNEGYPFDNKFGTVGCVALDQYGNIAAATSTGGLTNKRYQRIGDSPLIGCGTYANNASCAVSCTGKGEDFIRHVAANSIASMVEYGKMPLQAAVDSIIQSKIKSTKGRGGCIALNKEGQICFSFTTTGMFRGSIDSNGEKYIAIYEEEK